MVVTDPIADLLITIKNGYLARKKTVKIRWSKVKQSLAEILMEEGFIKDVKVQKPKDSKFKILELDLKYKGKLPALNEVKRVSKPGVRIYTKAKNIPKVKRGLKGVTIVSTSQGLMTNFQAEKKNYGGEIICQIW